MKNRIEITPSLFIPLSEFKFSFIRSPGPGGQNANKVATGVHLHFAVITSPSLSEVVRARCLKILSGSISNNGDLIIKATRYRTQARNKEDALARFVQLINKALTVPKKRKKTKPTHSATQRRLESKKKHAKNKALRSQPKENDSF